jgi:hypothetical protein
MAKIVLENGVVIEGTVEELAQMADKFGAKHPEDEGIEIYEKVGAEHRTDEEVAQAKAEYERKQAEQKWAKIGRKPNEFKKGDIVRVIDSPGALPIGTIFEVQRLDALGCVVDHVGYHYFPIHNRIELITPVESRFDTAEDAE